MKLRNLFNKSLYIIHSSLLIVNCTLLITLLLFSCDNSDNKQKSKETKEIKEPEFLYGICIDSLDVKLDTIKKNQYLSEIMKKQNVDYGTIVHIERNHKDVFDIRKIKPGHKHTFLLSRDSLATPLFWIYEIDKINFVVFSLTDSLTAWRDEKTVDIKTEHIEGVINTSLWNAIKDANGDANLTMELSDIYSWTVDFFGIQPGDTFKVVYENRYIHDECIGMGKILACYLNNAGSKHYAYYFEQNGNGQYFDENGANLRFFLKEPSLTLICPTTFKEININNIRNNFFMVIKIN